MYRKLYILLFGIDFTKIVQLAQKETKKLPGRENLGKMYKLFRKCG